MTELYDQLPPYLQFAPGPVFGTLCVLFLLGIPLIWWRYARTRRRPTVRFSSVGELRTLPAGPAARLHWLIPALRTAAILALVYALARPQSGGEVQGSAEGIAIEMVLDVSGSMSETDFALEGKRVRRLDAVKEVFKEFVQGSEGLPGRPNDLIGMTTFAMYADARCPLTPDRANLVNLLKETEIPGWVRGVQRYRHPESSYTALGDAIVLATDQLRRAGEQAVAGVPGAEPAKSLVMILLTDGANNPAPQFADSSPDPEEAARLAGGLGIRIYTIGAIGGRAKERGFGIFAARTADFDEGALRRIADATGGKYFRATDTDSLRTIYDEIDKLERRSTGKRTYEDNITAARTAMLIGLGLLCGEVALAGTRFRRLP